MYELYTPICFPHARTNAPLPVVGCKGMRGRCPCGGNTATQSQSWQPLAGLLMTLSGGGAGIGSSFTAEQEGPGGLNPLIASHAHIQRERGM